MFIITIYYSTHSSPRVLVMDKSSIVSNVRRILVELCFDEDNEFMLYVICLHV